MGPVQVVRLPVRLPNSGVWPIARSPIGHLIGTFLLTWPMLPAKAAKPSTPGCVRKDSVTVPEGQYVRGLGCHPNERLLLGNDLADFDGVDS